MQRLVFHHRWILAVPILAMGCIPLFRGDPGGKWVTQDRFVRDHYVANGRRIPLQVSLTRIAVVFSESTKTMSARALARRFHLDITEQFSSHVFFLSFKQPQTRSKLIAAYRALKREPGVSTAGLLVYTRKPTAPVVVGDEFLVRFKQNTSRADIDVMNSAHEVEIVSKNPWIDDLYLLRVHDDSPFDAITAAKAYRTSALTVLSQPDWLYLTFDLHADVHRPDDPFFEEQRNLLNEGPEGVAGADAKVAQAWKFLLDNGVALGGEADETFDENDVAIAIIDGGVGWRHEDLRPNLFINPDELGVRTADPTSIRDNDGNGLCNDVHGYDFYSGSPGPDPVTGCRRGDTNPEPRAGEGRGDDHGTPVAGIAAARGDNAIGVSGACPNCKVLPIRLVNVLPTGRGEDDLVDAIAYSASLAQVVNMSWTAKPAGITTAAAMGVQDAINNERSGLGTVFVKSLPNDSFKDICTGIELDPIAMVPQVISVGASTNLDTVRHLESGVATCKGYILAPSGRVMDNMPPPIFPATHNVTTTDRTGPAGYNDARPVMPYPGFCTAETPNLDYTKCFTGTSAAAPLVSGIVGLVLSLTPDLTAREVQRLLHDTADKIDAEYDRGTDTAAQYEHLNGFGAEYRGFGRVNAFEAVLAAQKKRRDVSVLDLQVVDLFMRDNVLDWGNTTAERDGRFGSAVLSGPTGGSIPHWHSSDIKVDAEPFVDLPAPGSNISNWFDTSLEDESPSAAGGARVYVRVRNRGRDQAPDVRVKLLRTFAGTGLPQLPDDFWRQFPADFTGSAEWELLPCRAPSEVSSGPGALGGTYTCEGTHTARIHNVGYSGASVAGCPGSVFLPPCDSDDDAQVVVFDFTEVTGFDPTERNPNHYCLAALVESEHDPLVSDTGAAFGAAGPIVNRPGIIERSVVRRTDPDFFSIDWLTPRYNNITQRNIRVEDSSSVTSAEERFWARNPTDQVAMVTLRVDVQRGFKAEMAPVHAGQPVRMRPGEAKLVTLRIALPYRGARGNITVVQETRAGKQTIVGGMTYSFKPELDQKAK